MSRKTELVEFLREIELIGVDVQHWLLSFVTLLFGIAHLLTKSLMAAPLKKAKELF